MSRYQNGSITVSKTVIDGTVTVQKREYYGKGAKIGIN